MYASFGKAVDFSGFPVDSGINPLKKRMKLPDLSEEPKGEHLCFKRNLWISVNRFPLKQRFPMKFTLRKTTCLEM